MGVCVFACACAACVLVGRGFDISACMHATWKICVYTCALCGARLLAFVWVSVPMNSFFDAVLEMLRRWLWF